MPSGGAREGAGRKKGSPTSRRLKIAEEALESGPSPLVVMIAFMRDQYASAQAAKPGSKTRILAMARAAEAAKNAAPYVHPRLNAVNHTEGGAKSWRDVFRLVEDASAEADRRNAPNG